MRKIAGTHFIMDGYVVDGQVLNPDTICTLFDRLVDALDMQYLQRPVAMRVPFNKDKLESDDDEGGWSAICQITTSHIALHGWPMRGAFMMDVFSCKRFDHNIARSIIAEMLNVSDVIMHVIDREDPR